MADPNARSRGVGSREFFLWIFLTALFSAIHLSIWSHAGLARDSDAWESFVKPLGNLVHLLTIPGWVATKALFNAWGDGDLFAAVFACAVGSALIVLAIKWLRSARRFLGAIRPSASSQALGPVSPKPDSGADLSRRRLLVDGVFMGGFFSIGAVAAQAACFEPEDLTLRRYSVPIRGLPLSLQGLRLAQISDTHLGPRIPASHVRRAIQMALDLDPDVFLLTGDYVHCGTEFILPAARMFRLLMRTGRPVLGVLGNHDWYNGGVAMRDALRAEGVRMIDNSRVFLRRKAPGTACEVFPSTPSGSPVSDLLCVAGFGDLKEDEILPKAALGGIDECIPRILLSHNPDSAEERSVIQPGSPRIDLMLCGHTHGGQVYIPGLGTGSQVFLRTGDKYAGGLVQGPAFPVIVSRGVGISMVPLRFLVPPEIVEITLTRAEDSSTPAGS